jgi:GNAT superfamily N-acetyltransferase
VTIKYTSVRLDDEHDLDAFDCGNDVMNAWLATQARRAQKSGTAATWVWVAEDAPARVWAYYALAPTAVARAELTPKQAGGTNMDIPGYLLARLAVHRDLRGHGYGSEVLVDALIRAYRASDDTGGRLVVVDAIDDAAAGFYEHHDFKPVIGNSHRLVLKLSTVAGMIG